MGTTAGLAAAAITYVMTFGWAAVLAMTLVPSIVDLQTLGEATALKKAPSEVLVARYPALEELPADERGPTLMAKIAADNVIGSAYGVWLGVMLCVFLVAPVGIYSTMAGGYLLRRDGWSWGILIPYYELCLSGFALASVPVVLIPSLYVYLWLCGTYFQLLSVMWYMSSPHIVVTLLTQVLTALLLFLAVTRSWHWLVHLTLLYAVFVPGAVLVLGTEWLNILLGYICAVLFVLSIQRDWHRLLRFSLLGAFLVTITGWTVPSTGLTRSGLLGGIVYLYAAVMLYRQWSESRKPANAESAAEE